MPDNTITIVGNLTRDPELRFTKNGVPRAILGVAVNRRWNNRVTNEWEEQVSFFNAVCWRDLAQNVSDSLSRGARVVITGRLEQRSWETPEGEKRNIFEIVVDDVGPSLRWATAQVTKTSGTGAGGAERRRNDQPAHAGAAAPAAAPAAPAGPAASEEEPF
ncbi:MAG TPA: single-stranded DNA-binding protein [Acidimicrobiaceae bacterium]|nr:single-stranded DNA-binding protein [Acidimicrobiaceae bacterium]